MASPAGGRVPSTGALARRDRLPGGLRNSNNHPSLPLPKVSLVSAGSIGRVKGRGFGRVSGARSAHSSNPFAYAGPRLGGLDSVKAGGSA